MELKRSGIEYEDRGFRTFNRTIMELKPAI